MLNIAKLPIFSEQFLFIFRCEKNFFINFAYYLTIYLKFLL